MSPAAHPPDPLPGVVDAHAHTWSREFDDDRDAVFERAWSTGLAAIIDVGVDAASSRRCLEAASADPRIHAVAGLHPHDAKRLDQEHDRLRALVEAGGFVGIGETGLDFYRNLSSAAEQHEAFRWHLDLAVEARLPVVIHSRSADEETYRVLEEWVRRVGRYLGAGREIGMMHCYAGDVALAERYQELGFLISVPGPVTFPKNARGQAVARDIPLDRMLVETDCPYLTPVPWRGRRNEPAYVAETARSVARLRSERPEDVARATAENAARLFGFALEHSISTSPVQPERGRHA